MQYTLEQLGAILSNHSRWLRSDGGARANLAGADLTDVNLRDADLRDADLAGANLTDANLTDADLRDANLAGANLAGANLAGVDLAGANLAGAYLRDAYLAGVCLADVRGVRNIRHEFKGFRFEKGIGGVFKVTHLKTGCTAEGLILHGLYDTVRVRIRETRKDNRALEVSYPYRYRGMLIACSGGLPTCHPTHILKQVRRHECFSTKHPNTDLSHIGIELEFLSSIPHEELADRLYTWAKYIQIKTDGSLRSRNDTYTHNTELTICVPENLLKEVVRGVCGVLRGVTNVNTTCGMHVHVDCRNRDAHRVYNNLVKAQPLLFAMTPPSRRDNQYCKYTRDSDLYDVIGSEECCCDDEDCDGSCSDVDYGRYWAVNGTAYNKFQTIEVRVHSGTTEAAKILNWCELLLAISNARYIERFSSTLGQIAYRFRLNKRLVNYCYRRIVRHSGEGHSLIRRITERRAA